MRAQTLQELAAAIGLVAWGVLLVIAGTGRNRRVFVLNLRWEGHQDDVKRYAARATTVLGVASVLFGLYLFVAAFVR